MNTEFIHALLLALTVGLYLSISTSNSLQTPQSPPQSPNSHQKRVLAEWKETYHANSKSVLEKSVGSQTGAYNRNELADWDKHVHTVIDRDAYNGWLNAKAKGKSLVSSFGKTELSRLRNQSDRMCVANLYYRSRSLVLQPLCWPGNFRVFEEFTDCWSYEIRKTRMGQYLIWRMMKTIENCYGRDQQDIELLRHLRTKIIWNDSSDHDKIQEELTTLVVGQQSSSTDDEQEAHLSLEAAKSLMDIRKQDTESQIAQKMFRVDSTLAKNEAKRRKTMQRFKRMLVGAMKMKRANSSSRGKINDSHNDEHHECDDSEASNDHNRDQDRISMTGNKSAGKRFHSAAKKCFIHKKNKQ